jgi:predicted nucleic acid-binding protein
LITALDSSVVLDVISAHPRFGEPSKAVLRQALREGSLIACEVVWAEVIAAFPDANSGIQALHRIGLEYRSIESIAVAEAGQAWRHYRQRGGTRERILADFLIGTHAMHAADRLVTRDRGFYRTYFQGLRLLNPTN